MKSKIILAALCCLFILSGCGDDPQNVFYPTADFSVSIAHPHYVVLTDKSYRARSYHWDFGDGTTSYEMSPTHKYSGKGVYKIKLTVTSSTGNTDSKEANVTIENPNTCYISGITYDQIPKQNEYYMLKMIDDDFFTTTWMTTYWEMLSSAVLPYSRDFKNPILMDGLSQDEYYYLDMYQNSKDSGTGTRVARWKINTSTIMQFPEEIQCAPQSGAAARIRFKWLKK